MDSWSDGHPVANHGETRAPRGANAAGPMHLEVTRTKNKSTERIEKIRRGQLQLRDFSPNNDHLFHSTSSKAWPGLKLAGGLVPGKSLKKYGIKRLTGEGDRYAEGEKESIFFGRGTEGLGTALAYFQLNKDSTNFSPHLYSDENLTAQLRKVRHVVSNWTQPPEYHLSGDGGFGLSLTQAQNRLCQLETEMELRKVMPHRPKNTRPYPMMFDVKDVHVDDVYGIIEVRVSRQVMFRDNLVRVFVPVENLEHAKNQLGQILGDNHSVDVIPMESLMKTLQDAEDDPLDDDKAKKMAATALKAQEEIYETIDNQEFDILDQYERAVESLEARENKLSI